MAGAPSALTGTGNVTSNSTTSGAALALPKPANLTDGQLMVADLYARNAGDTVTAPSGWTQVGVQATANGTLVSFIKPVPSAAAESGTSTYSFSFTGGSQRIAGQIQLVTGANLTTPVDAVGTATPSSAGASTVQVPGLTTAHNAVLLRGVIQGNTTTSTPAGLTSPSGWTAPGQVDANTGTAVSSLLVGTRQYVVGTGVTVATVSFTASPPATNSSGYMYAIAPAIDLAGPTPSFTTSPSGLTVAFDATSSTAVSPATISSYAWSFGDTSTGTGATPSHSYASAGSYSVTLTVTDSQGLSGTLSASVPVQQPGNNVGPVALVTAPAWTVNPTGSDTLTDISDSSASTYILSSSPPTAQEVSVTLGALSRPSAGTPIVVTLDADKVGATSGSVTGKLFEGSTQRSSVTVSSIPDGTAGTNVTGQVTLTFPSTDVANITNFNALKLQLLFTAS